MKKLIAMLFVMALSVPVFAEYRHSINSSTEGNYSTTYSTPCTTACEVYYIQVTSTGTVVSQTLTIRDSATAKFTIVNAAGASAGDVKVIDLSNSPVRFSTNLNVYADNADTSLRYTIVYRKLN